MKLRVFNIFYFSSDIYLPFTSLFCRLCAEDVFDFDSAPKLILRPEDRLEPIEFLNGEGWKPNEFSKPFWRANELIEDLPILGLRSNFVCPSLTRSFRHNIFWLEFIENELLLDYKVQFDELPPNFIEFNVFSFHSTWTIMSFSMQLPSKEFTIFVFISNFINRQKDLHS